MSSSDLSPKRIAELTAAARAAIDELATADPAALSEAGLADQVVEVVGLAGRAEAVAARAVGTWEARAGWRADGFASARAWVAGRGELGLRSAGRVLALGRFLHAFDHSRRAVMEGTVSTEAGRMLARAGAGKRVELYRRDEALLVDLAARLRPDDLERALRRWMVLADDELADAEADAAYFGRSAHLSNVGDQTRLDGTWHPTAGAVIHAAVERAMGRPDPADHPGGPRTTAQRRADAIEEICTFFLDNTELESDDGGGRRPARATVAVRVDLDVLTGSDADVFDPTWWADLTAIGPIGRNTLRRLLCDSWVSRVVTRGRDLPLDLGARARFFTDAQRNALIARDGGTCVVPGCTVPVERCHAHHLDPVGEGGATDLDNGAHLCSFHHHAVHEGGWLLERHGDGSWSFASPWRRSATRRAFPDAA